MKREKNNISIPTVDDSFKWNFEGVKVLIGQGKLVCRLNTTETSLFATVVGNRGNSSKNSQIITIIDHEEYHIEHSNEQIVLETGDQNEILESSSNQPVSANVNSTNVSSIQIGSREAELDELVHDLLTEQDSSTGIFQSLQDALKYLKSKMSDESEKLKVDKEDVLSHALTYFKNPSINIHKLLQVRYRGQPAIDAGGVCRQFVTTVYEQILSGADGIPPLFEGDAAKLPIFNTHFYKCVTEGNQPLMLVEFVDSSLQQYMNKYYLGQMEFHPYLKVMLPSYPYLIHTLQFVRSWWQLVKL